MTTLTTRLKIASWDEKPTQELADGAKLARAAVELSDGTDGIDSGSCEMLMYYRPDGTGSYVTLMRLVGTLDGRSGTFVALGDGTFDGGTARIDAQVATGSGTEALAGISGRVESVSTHDDYPHMPLTLTYDLG